MSKSLELESIHEIARGTIEFSFVKPEGFTHLAGQNVNLKLPELHYPDQKGPRRTFTIASAPHESRLIFATRISDSGYKQTLKALAPGALFEYLGPNGKFIYDAEVEAAAYVAGGIGITPFRSMLLHGIQEGLKVPTRLFYANAAPATAAWHHLFDGLASRESKFSYVPTMNKVESGQEWSGETRFLSADLLQEYLPEMNRTTFFICGPPAMINALTEQLRSKGIDEKQIRSESLWGY